MDTRILKFLAVFLIFVIILFETETYIRPNTKTIDSIVEEEISEETDIIVEEQIELLDTNEEYLVNNTLEEILVKTERANNWDKVGNINGQEVHVLKCPELTTKPIFYSDSNIPVLYDDYVCIKYDAEKENEQYIMLVYYFNSDDMWEGWYKYFVASSIKEANIIAKEEEERGYAVWIDGNIVMEGEIFNEISVSKSGFLESFLYQFENVVYMNE